MTTCLQLGVHVMKLTCFWQQLLYCSWFTMGYKKSMLFDLQQTLLKLYISMGFKKLFLLFLFTVALSHALPTVEPELATLQDGYIENGQCEVATKS